MANFAMLSQWTHNGTPGGGWYFLMTGFSPGAISWDFVPNTEETLIMRNITKLSFLFSTWRSKCKVYTE